MPQMAPLNWICLMLYFNLMMILIIMYMYFTYTPYYNLPPNKLTKIKFMMKW